MLGNGIEGPVSEVSVADATAALEKVQSACVQGIQAQLIDVEADLSPSARHFYHVVGLPGTAIKESSARVRGNRAVLKGGSQSQPRKA